MISKNKNEKDTPPERITHFGSISIDDGVGDRIVVLVLVVIVVVVAV